MSLIRYLIEEPWKEVWLIGVSDLSPYYDRLIFRTSQEYFQIKSVDHMILPPNVLTRSGDDIFSLSIELISPNAAIETLDSHRKTSVAVLHDNGSIQYLLQPPRVVHFYTQKDFDLPKLHIEPGVLWRCVAVDIASAAYPKSRVWVTAEMMSLGFWTGAKAADYPKDWFVEYVPEPPAEF